MKGEGWWVEAQGISRCDFSSPKCKLIPALRICSVHGPFKRKNYQPATTLLLSMLRSAASGDGKTFPSQKHDTLIRNHLKQCPLAWLPSDAVLMMPSLTLQWHMNLCIQRKRFGNWQALDFSTTARSSVQRVGGASAFLEVQTTSWTMGPVGNLFVSSHVHAFERKMWEKPLGLKVHDRIPSCTTRTFCRCHWPQASPRHAAPSGTPPPPQFYVIAKHLLNHKLSRPHNSQVPQPSARPHEHTTQVWGEPHLSRQMAHSHWLKMPISHGHHIHKGSTKYTVQPVPPGCLERGQLAKEWRLAFPGASSHLALCGAHHQLRPHRQHPRESAIVLKIRFAPAAPYFKAHKGGVRRNNDVIQQIDSNWSSYVVISWLSKWAVKLDQVMCMANF